MPRPGMFAKESEITSHNYMPRDMVADLAYLCALSMTVTL